MLSRNVGVITNFIRNIFILLSIFFVLSSCASQKNDLNIDTAIREYSKLKISMFTAQFRQKLGKTTVC
jgi:hypothetical protein